MCKRAIEPRHGFWTMPAGFMENGESVQQAAAREAMEEALAHVQIGSLLAIVHVLRAHQVHILFRARLLEPRFGVGPESLEVKLVEERDIPWPRSRFSASISPCAATSKTAPPARATAHHRYDSVSAAPALTGF